MFRHRQINVQNIAAQIRFGGSFFVHFSSSHPSSESRTKYYYYVLRTIRRIYLPSVESVGFDPRYFVPLLHLPVASASKHCLWQTMRR